jgi:hypothetical protein
LGSSDAARAIRERNAARAEVEALVKAFPTDPDVLVSAAVQGRAFDGDGGTARALERANLALESAPNDGERHTLVFAARQTIARALDKSRPAQAAAQWETLLLAARNAGEEANLASAYLGFFERRKDAAGAARLLARLANEGWDFEGSRALLDAGVNRVLGSALLPEIVSALREDASPPAQIAFATLAAARLERTRTILLDPAAPRFGRRRSGARHARHGFVDSGFNPNRRRHESRSGGARGDMAGRTRCAFAEDALKWLRRARALEPGDASLRLTLIGVLQASEATREEAARERRSLETSFAFEPEIARLLSLESWEAGDNASASARSEEAFNVAAHNPFVRANDLQNKRSHARESRGQQANLGARRNSTVAWLCSNGRPSTAPPRFWRGARGYKNQGAKRKLPRSTRASKRWNSICANCKRPRHSWNRRRIERQHVVLGFGLNSRLAHGTLYCHERFPLLRIRDDRTCRRKRIGALAPVAARAASIFTRRRT